MTRNRNVTLFILFSFLGTPTPDERRSKKKKKSDKTEKPTSKDRLKTPSSDSKPTAIVKPKHTEKEKRGHNAAKKPKEDNFLKPDAVI